MAEIEKVIKGKEHLDAIMEVATHLVYPDYGAVQEHCLALLALLKEQERKKGSWDYGTQCSVCKGTIIPPQDRKIRVNFCPWCGADMRESYE